MGSQRRLLAELEDQGIVGDAAWTTLEAVETLRSAGDDFSDALYHFLEEGDREKALETLQSVLASVTSAVEKASETISAKN